MGKYLLIIVLFLFVGCETPQEKNKKSIENLQQKVENLEEKSYKIDDLESQLKEIKKRQDIIQNTINDNKILAKLNLLDKKLKAFNNNSSEQNNTNLQNEITRLNQKFNLLENRLKRLKPSSNTDIQKLKKEIKQLKEKSITFDYIVIHPMTLITIKKTNIYAKPFKSAKIIKIYPKATTFTTYKEKNGFVKVTGYFIHNKWVENKQEWWIPKENTAVKRLAK